ncbi:MAG: response regulator [Pyrinomonadaceae bacterium]
MTDKLRILIVDDHQIIRDGLKGLINAEADMEVVGEAGDGQMAWQQAKELQPDVVLMDVSMPKLNGAKATERLKKDRPETKVLALTAHEDKGYIGQMLQAGASGYVLKIAAAEELIKAIRVVVGGGAYLDPAVADKVVSNYIRQKSTKQSARSGALTGREEEVLRLVAQGYINKEIAASLDISVKTVESHKTNFMEKLGLHSRAEIVRYALGQGWLQDT